MDMQKHINISTTSFGKENFKFEQAKLSFSTAAINTKRFLKSSFSINLEKNKMAYSPIDITRRSHFYYG